MTGILPFPRRLVPLPLLLLSVMLILAPRIASAQYMYLDSDGDGVHTAADGLSQVGTTQVDIWLRTDHDRDGSVATCPTGEDLSIVSYVVCLQVVDGTVSFTNAANLVSAFGGRYRDEGTDSEYILSYYGSAFLPAGTYHLARITVTALSGTPALAIVPTLPSHPVDSTSFGSLCSGIDFDNTLKLGSDWLDADGLPAGAGGTVNAPPLIPPIAPLAGVVGDPAVEDVAIVDPNGDPITVRKSDGPASLYVTGMNAVPGALTARLQVVGRRGDVGTHAAAITAGDGTLETDGPFSIQISSGPNHPPVIRPVGRLDVVAGATATASLVADDPDGDPVTFAKQSGPDYATVTTLGTGAGASAGRIVLRPALCSVGDALLVVSASDGSSATRLDVPVRVHPPLPPPSDPVRTIYVPIDASCLAVGDFNEDGHMDAAAGNESYQGSAISLYSGDGNGDVTAAGTIPFDGALAALAAGDWNGDGHVDLAAGTLQGQSLAIFYGNGDGTFRAPVSFPDVFGGIEFATSDVNGDGVSDLVDVDTSGHVVVLLGGPQGLTTTFRVQESNGLRSVAVADFDRDGFADMATALVRDVAVYRGRGDGSLGDRRSVPSLRYPHALVAGDWNGDGKPDLAVASFDEGLLAVLPGDGAGGFGAGTTVPIPILVSRVRSVDWNLDGIPDLFVAAYDSSPILLGAGDGTFVPMAGTPAPGARGAAIADMNEDGRPDLVTAAGGTLRVQLNTTVVPGTAAARAFADASNRSVPAARSSASVEFRIEPLGGSFAPEDVDPSSVRLLSDGTGSVSSVAAQSVKSASIGDTDRNGVQEYPADFAAADVAMLFDGINGRQTLLVHVSGALSDGRE
ncbi:MAG: FG-GAP repeat domain-containing protein, partial [Hyphomicrobiales bacterium]